jgi:hypothetical protein
LPQRLKSKPPLRRLDCTLTRIETKVDSKSDFESEKRPISVVFDEQTKALTVYQNGNALVLNNVTTTVNSMSGYVDQVSLGINSADWNICVPDQQFRFNALRIWGLQLEQATIALKYAR